MAWLILGKTQTWGFFLDKNYSLITFTAHLSDMWCVCQKNTSLKIFVVVTPKEGLAGRAPWMLLLCEFQFKTSNLFFWWSTKVSICRWDPPPARIHGSLTVPMCRSRVVDASAFWSTIEKRGSMASVGEFSNVPFPGLKTHFSSTQLMLFIDRVLFSLLDLCTLFNMFNPLRYSTSRRSSSL